MEIKQRQEGVYPLNIELPSLKSLYIEMYFGEQL